MFNNENAQEALHALGRSSKKTAHVSVRVYYTQEYARVTNDITQEIEDMVAKANQVQYIQGYTWHLCRLTSHLLGLQE